MSDCLRRHNNKTIICLSHLAWDMALFQRPHQLMSCFDEMDYTVLYVGCTGTKAKKRLTANGKFGNHGVYVNLDYSPFANPIVRYVRHKEVLAQAQSLTMNEENNTVLWITQPLLGSFTSSIRHSKIVFDAMDPYLNFEKHTNRLEDSISQLCSEADLVFTGGKSMHQNLLHDYPAIQGKCHCFPSGVNWEHFEKSTLADTPIYPCVAQLTKPVWGYFGAIDERIDISLINALCSANTGGSIVLAGPILNSYFCQEKAQLPPNLFLTGAVPYTNLPNLLKSFDVSILPFKRSELVNNISPTKTPEYLAGRHPIVSTYVPDIKQTWGAFVNIGETNEEFTELCRNAKPVNDTEYLRAKHCAQSWNDISQAMNSLIWEKC